MNSQRAKTWQSTASSVQPRIRTNIQSSKQSKSQMLLKYSIMRLSWLIKVLNSNCEMLDRSKQDHERMTWSVDWPNRAFSCLLLIFCHHRVFMKRRNLLRTIFKDRVHRSHHFPLLLLLLALTRWTINNTLNSTKQKDKATQNCHLNNAAQAAEVKEESLMTATAFYMT